MIHSTAIKNHFSAMRALALSLLLIAFLAACGMKGPLYLPPPEEPSKTEKK